MTFGSAVPRQETDMTLQYIFPQAEQHKASGWLGRAGITRIFNVLFSGNDIIISKCLVDARLWFNTLQLCVAH